MNEDQMYESIRILTRQKVNILQAFYEVLKNVQAETMPFRNGENDLYVKCSLMPRTNFKTIDFLATSNFLEWDIVAFNSVGNVPIPYIHIYQKQIII